MWFWDLPKKQKSGAALYMIIAMTLMYLMAKLGALLYLDPRPFVTGHFIPLIPHAPDNGFPSDHTLLTAALAALIFPFNRKISTTIWIITALVGFSRVYAGIHHPVDIVGSVGIALLVSFFMYVLAGRKNVHIL